MTAISKEKMERNLSEFIKQSWAVIEPNTPYVANWHTDLISEYLQAINNSEILRLVINIPPRHMKSLHTTVFYPAWTWIKYPEKRFIKVSYSDFLSRKYNILCRDVIKSPWYQHNWENRFKIKEDDDRQNMFKNDHHGLMYSTSTGGTLIGEGGDVIIVDDPQNPRMVNSVIERETSIAFFTNTLQTRLNNPQKGAIIIIMQRLHEQDLTGYILSENLGYHHLCLPAEAEKRTIIHFPISGKQIIREEGDILNSERFNKTVLTNLKKAMGSAQYIGQFQQQPSPAEGGLLKRDWWQYYKQTPTQFDEIIQSWDMTFKETISGSYVVGQIWGRVGANKYLLDQVRDRMDFPTTLSAVRNLSAKWPQANAKLVEDKANGPAVIDALRREVSGLIAVAPQGSKEARVAAISPDVEAGNVHLPASNIAPWIHDFVEECTAFPKATTDDQCDCMSQALLRFARTKPLTDDTKTLFKNASLYS